MNVPIESASLPVGHKLLDGQFEILDLLGQGGFAYTYLAYEHKLKRNVAIKEYMPDMWSRRTTEFAISAKSDKTSVSFNWGLERFLQEAQILATCPHQGVVNVITFFEANGTAYLVMQYEEGGDLGHILRSREAAFTFEELRKLFSPVLEGLGQLHAAGTIHRDIKPSNIIVRLDGSGVLIDFGSARGLIGDSTETSGSSPELTSLVTAGYSPIEQFGTVRSEQGPWTDIYALGATLYHVVTGERPKIATDRILAEHDPVEPARALSKPGFGSEFLEAIDWALQTRPNDRPQSIQDWGARLFPGSQINDQIGQGRPTTGTRIPGEVAPLRRQSDVDPGETVLKKPAESGGREEQKISETSGDRSEIRSRFRFDKSKKRAAIVLLIAAVALVIGRGIFLLAFPPLDPSDALAAGKWRDALRYYGDLGRQESDPVAEEEGRQTVVDWLQQRITTDLDANRLEQAVSLYAEATRELPNETSLYSLADAIEGANTTIHAREQRLDEAATQLREKRWREAFDSYRSIPESSPLAATAKKGEREIVTLLVQEIGQFLDANDLDAATALHSGARAMFPRDAKFIKLGKRVDDVRVGIELDQQRVADAEQQLQAGMWHEALESYRAVSNDSPFATSARSGEQVLAQWLIEQVEGHLEKAAIDKASTLNAEAIAAFPGESRLLALEKLLNERRTTLESENQQIATARKFLSNGRWRDALKRYRELPRDDLVGQAAQDGEQDVISWVIGRIDQHLDDKDAQAAEDLYKAAIDQFPTEARFESFGPAVTELQSAFVKEQQQFKAADRLLSNERWRDALNTYRSLRNSISQGEAAIRGEQAVRNWLVKKIEGYAENEKLDAAATLSADAIAEFPDDTQLRSLKEAIDKSQEIVAADGRLLAGAVEDIKNGRWRAALDSYRSIPEESGIASQARVGEESILQWIIERITARLQAGELDSATSLLTDGVAAFPRERPRLDPMRNSIEEAKREAERSNTPGARAERHLENNRWREALAEYRSISPRDGNSADIKKGEQRVGAWLATSIRADLSTLRSQQKSGQKKEAGRLFKGIVDRHTEAVQALPANRELAIDITFQMAGVAYDFRWFTSPAGRNANELLNQVLLFEPGNKRALEHKAKIAAWYVQRTREQMKKGALGSADRFLRSARSVVSDSVDISKVAAELKNAHQLANAPKPPKVDQTITKPVEKPVVDSTPIQIEEPKSPAPKAAPTEQLTLPVSVEHADEPPPRPQVVQPAPTPSQVVEPAPKVPEKKRATRLPPP